MDDFSQVVVLLFLSVHVNGELPVYWVRIQNETEYFLDINSLVVQILFLVFFFVQ